jgi:hypothetical protein
MPATAHDISVTGIGLTLHRCDYDDLPLQVPERVGIMLDYAGERLICAAFLRYIKDLPDEICRLGLRFDFNPADMEHRFLSNKLERMVAAMNREMLRRRAYYGE